MTATLTRSCRVVLLSSFILVSYIAMISSMTLDLTEMRNKVSKIKVNPRWNLWATGHFMGKKSIVESDFEDLNVPVGAVKNPRLLSQILKRSPQTQDQQAMDM